MFSLKVDEDLSLRLYQPEDAEELFNLTIESKKYLKQWLGWLDYTNTAEDSASFIHSSLSAYEKNGEHPQAAAIIYKGKIAGTIGFNEISTFHKIGVIGYWLADKYQGKGIMSRAFSALVHYGFEEADLNRLEVRAAAGNVKSRALPERLGFTEEGRIREAEWLYDHYVDHIVYGLLKKEYISKETNVLHSTTI
ncbi:N-acetyltransferase [Bacillus infantis]|uniref:GNAT family N-acetyltransferase n=1 Tax=Bacillus infantis TaxID=324767 RepID=UPI00101DAF40|nr:GNAT family protein [Bacillus infantis]RYI29508.1 N-acetyltransferase [Bacillus infantis]